MRHLMATAAVMAALCGPTQVAAQDQQDLQRMIEDAIDTADPKTTPAPRPLADEFTDAELVLFTADELDELVAPVALYPDALLAQVLVASTFPLQIVQADRLLAESDAMSDDELTEAIEAREWDPSVLVLLTGFPEVIRRMAEDLDDTERLGLAMAQQDADVLDSVQRLRLQAEATGYLADNEAQVVEREGDRIVIEPADPEVIYVPRYDEQLAFTSAPTAAPVIQAPGTGIGLGNPLVAGAIGFGSALLVNELFGDDDDNGNNNNNNNKDGWNNYWRNDRRAIDWREREIYPRAYGWDDNVERRREVAWSRERDRYWDQQGRRWRAEAERERRDEWRARRADRDWEIRRDPRTGAAQVRLRDWSDVRAASERRENLRDATAERDAARRAAQARDREREADRATSARREERAADEARRRQAAERERERDAARREAREAEPSGQQSREAAEQRRRQQAERERERDAARREAREAEPSGQQTREAAEQRRRQQAEREAARSESESRERRAERAAEERRAAERDRAERQAAEARREEENRSQRQAAQRRAAQQAEAQEEAAATRREAAVREREAARREAAVREREAQQARGRDASQRQAREQERQAEQARARQQEQRQAEERGDGGQQRARRDCPEGPAGRACRRGN